MSVPFVSWQAKPGRSVKLPAKSNDNHHGQSVNSHTFNSETYVIRKEGFTTPQFFRAISTRTVINTRISVSIALQPS